MINDVIQKMKFSDIDVSDEFFDSLLDDYAGFVEWFKKKVDDFAYVFIDDEKIDGFMYLKEETEADDSISPPFEATRRLKIGTLKINPHGTVLGQRFLGIALREMYSKNYDETYVTVFDKQDTLISLFEKYGFALWGYKENGESVYIKNKLPKDNVYHDFPAINTVGNNKFVLAIHPKFHTEMFPESRLVTEKSHNIEDLSFTNTIEKIYISDMDKMQEIVAGDNIVIYRTAEKDKSAEYNSVATTICTAIESRTMSTFSSLEEYLDFCGKGSIFSEDQLRGFWRGGRYKHIIKLLYNAPLPKRIIRRDLIEKIGLRRDEYWGCFQISDEQFQKILTEGELNESFVIH